MSTVKVARDLTEIGQLYERLLAQAIQKATAKIDGTSLPGGEAMVALAPVADPETNARRVELAEQHHLATCERTEHSRCWTGSEDEDDGEPVLQTLLFWSEQWREEHGYPLEGRRPTVATEANVIRSLLDWAWTNLAQWDTFAKDIRDARIRLENLLYAGARQERTRIVCNRCKADDNTTSRPRLIRLYGPEVDGSGDRWKCPACKVRLDADGVRDAHAAMLRSEGAAKWVPQVDAIGTLKAQGRSERTVRKWLAEGEGEAYCDPVTHEVWVWWPDLWRKHLTAATRTRDAS
ncbi:hypothetical protein CFH99_07855 [Nocardioides aromaticivorans]|uniref:Uncharacterized protein n=1 Tax=Nocardioides aromaticivorans TaxID=200618 RepID=A0ABX7PHZ2_9ACTN|nr:hypothetical protein CFH99_07855 [Nocardioides aromaticivorans]